MRSGIGLMTVAVCVCLAGPSTVLETARDNQDRASLERMAAEAAAKAAQSPNDAGAQYNAALVASYLAEVALELRDKGLAQRAAEAGIKPAERVVALRPNWSEGYRVLGTLCGQVIPANVLAGLSYGKRARDAVNKAVALDPKSGRAYLARGIGNYYLPAGLGGGVDRALTDFRKVVELEPGNADGWLWMGLSLRKQGQNRAARDAFSKGLKANPLRIWIKQQLEKTPAQ